ncbi:MAG: GDYXXLXY domain-containing protein [Anaerolineae bacterium]|nr:GDYXXLXY domain-containing protein [Anaerolineae bacterium]MDQ7037478.1 GDYXXLXY domain-containing protein [Anaerolineae bacterium]
MSMKTLRTLILFGTLLVFLYLVNTGIWSAEQNIADGQPVYLILAPVDPRSLIQGDYMRLDYQIERDATNDGLLEVERGQIVARLDENNVAHYARLYTTGESLADNEILLNFTTSEFGGVRIGVDSFFFQEGQASRYNAARYADVRVTEGGTIMLVDLVGENFEDLADDN